MSYNIFNPFILFIIYLHFSLDTLRCDKFTEERLSEWQEFQDDNEEQPEDVEKASSEPQELQMEHRGFEFIRDLRWMFRYNDISVTHMFVYSSYVINLVIFFLITMVYGVFSHTRHPETKEYISPVLRYLEFYYVSDMFGKYEDSKRFNMALSLNLLIAILNKWIYCDGHIRRAKMNRNQYRHLSIVQSTINYMHTLNLSTAEWIDLASQFIRHKCRNDNFFKDAEANLENRMIFQMSKIDRLYYHNVINFTDCFVGWKKHENKYINNMKSRGMFHKIIAQLQPEDNNYFVAQPENRIDLKDLSLVVISYVLSIILATITILICNYSYWYLAFVEAAVAGINLQETASPKIEWLVTNVILIISGTECGTILLTGIFCYSRIKQVTRRIEKELQVQRFYLRHFIYFLESSEAQVFEFLTIDNSQNTFVLSDQHFLNLRKKFKQRIDHSELLHHNENSDYIVGLVGVLRDELIDFKRAYTIVMNVITIFGLASTTIILTVARKSNSWSEVMIALPLVLLSATPIVFCSLTSAMVESALRNLVKRLSSLIGDGLGLFDQHVCLRMNGIYQHLSQQNNRSFILFANFPLSFSSLLTISAWICSVYQAMVEQGLIW